MSADGTEPLPGRAHHPRVRLRTVDEYRARYAQYRADPDLQHLHARHPMVSLWDDHEVANDWWAGGAAGHLATDGPFSTRLAAAMTAWREWHPRSPSRPEAWRRLPLGGLLDAFVVDGRSQRPRMGDGSEPGAEDDTLGPAQLAWLRSGLDGSAGPRGRWPVVLTQQPITPRFDRDGRRSARADWGGFPVAQATVLQLLAGVGATVVSGDLHGSWLLDRGGAGVEAVVPSVSSRSYADRRGDDAAAVEEADLRGTNAALRWVDVRSHGYVVLDADAERLRIEWWFVDTVEDRVAGQRLAHVLDVEST